MRGRRKTTRADGLEDDKLPARILDHVAAASKPLSAHQVSCAMGVSNSIAGGALVKLYRSGRLRRERGDDGHPPYTEKWLYSVTADTHGFTYSGDVPFDELPRETQEALVAAVEGVIAMLRNEAGAC